jgi:hypothetical protein
MAESQGLLRFGVWGSGVGVWVVKLWGFKVWVLSLVFGVWYFGGLDLGCRV